MEQKLCPVSIFFYIVLFFVFAEIYNEFALNPIFIDQPTITFPDPFPRK